MTCYKRVILTSRYNYGDNKFPKVITDKVYLNRPGLCRGSIIICLDGRRPETSRACAVYLCKKVTCGKYQEDLYGYEAVKIGMLDTENVNFDDKLWYVAEFNKLNKRIKNYFANKSFWYRLFHRPLLVPKLFCDRKNVKEYKGFI